jgi:choline dehydrogenase-like flavoprotein
MAISEITLDGSQSRTLAGLADAMIPAHGELPSWSEADPSGKWLARAMAARPELIGHLVRVLDGAAHTNRQAEAERLRESDPEGFGALSTIVAGSYYMNPKVRRRIGYPGEKTHPFGPGDAEYYLDEGTLLEPVIARGDISPQPPAEPAPADPSVFSKPFSIAPAVDGVADVLIIGSGASGGVAGKRLAEAGFRVVCLEQGRWMNPDEYPGSKAEFELLANGSQSADPNVRRMPSDYPCQTVDSDIAPIMYNAVGGSTIHFCAQWSRMRAADFKMRTLHAIGDDWPLTYRELLPYYARVDQEFGISGVVGDPLYPDYPAPPTGGIPIGEIGRVAARGMNNLGWHWWPASHDMPSEQIGTRPACKRRGVCMWGCPEGAKGSTDLTHWPLAIGAGAKMITGARVREIPVDQHGRATGAIYIDRDGKECFQAASVVIMCANGIGTPRVLLLSRSSRFPDGLANSSGLVGKRLMLHPYVSVLGIYEQPLESWIGPWGTQLLSLQFADHDESRGFPGGAQWDVMPLTGPMFTLERFDDRPYASRWGASIHEIINRTLGHAFDWGIGIEDLPREENRLLLDSSLTDEDGIPAPKIEFRIDQPSRDNLRFQLDRAREAHEAAGAIETLETDWSRWGWHLLGTCMMGDDPAASVVNRYGQAHDVPNLFVFDGSIFPTSGPQPPTATIAALALRNTDHLIAQARLRTTR